MVEQNGADRREPPEIVFVGSVIAVPGDDVERRTRDLGPIKFAPPFHEQGGGLIPVLVGGNRCEKIPGIGEAIGPDRTAIGQGEGTAVVFAHIGAGRPVDQLDLEDHAAGNDADLSGLDVDHAELGPEAQLVVLRDDQQLAVGIEEEFVCHRARHQQHVARHADLGIAIARSGHGMQTGDERELLLGDRNRIPALLSDGQRALLARRRSPDQPLLDPAIAARMLDGRPDPVEP